LAVTDLWAQQLQQDRELCLLDAARGEQAVVVADVERRLETALGDLRREVSELKETVRRVEEANLGLKEMVGRVEEANLGLIGELGETRRIIEALRGQVESLQKAATAKEDVLSVQRDVAKLREEMKASAIQPAPQVPPEKPFEPPALRSHLPPRGRGDKATSRLNIVARHLKGLFGL
jgi:chromosome segregation ATPase